MTAPDREILEERMAAVQRLIERKLPGSVGDYEAIRHRVEIALEAVKRSQSAQRDFREFNQRIRHSGVNALFDELEQLRAQLKALDPTIS
jgi:hypothetical protein